MLKVTGFGSFQISLLLPVFFGGGQGWSGFLFGFVLGGVLREFWVEVVGLDGQKNMTGESRGCWTSVDRSFDLSSCFVMR